MNCQCDPTPKTWASLSDDVVVFTSWLTIVISNRPRLFFEIRGTHQCPLDNACGLVVRLGRLFDALTTACKTEDFFGKRYGHDQEQERDNHPDEEGASLTRMMETKDFHRKILRSDFCSDDLFFEVRCQYLDTDMFTSCEEESRTDRGIEEDVFFLFCQLEDILQDVNRCGRLLEEELYRRVRDDGLTIRRTHEVLHILRNRRHTESVFAGALHETKEELRAIFVLHDIPRLIDDEIATLLARTRDIPHIVQEDIHRDRTQYLIEIAHREDDESFLQVDVGCMGEHSGKYSEYIFFQAIDDTARALHGLEYRVEVFEERDLLSLDRIVVHRDALQRVGRDEGFFDDGLFGRSDFSEHEF